MVQVREAVVELEHADARGAGGVARGVAGEEVDLVDATIGWGVEVGGEGRGGVGDPGAVAAEVVQDGPGGGVVRGERDGGRGEVGAGWEDEG